MIATAVYYLRRIRHELFYKRSNRPQLAPDAVRYLDRRLGKSDRVLEFGSGGSTVWFAERCAQVVSHEHDPAWHGTVQDRIRAKGIGNVDHKLYPFDNGTPIAYVTDAQSYGAFDVALIDGKRCSKCCAVAIDRLAPGGLLIIDNIDCYVPSESSFRFKSPASRGPDDFASEEWREIWSVVAGWERQWFSNGFIDTLVAHKPG